MDICALLVFLLSALAALAFGQGASAAWDGGRANGSAILDSMEQELQVLRMVSDGLAELGDDARAADVRRAVDAAHREFEGIDRARFEGRAMTYDELAEVMDGPATRLINATTEAEEATMRLLGELAEAKRAKPEGGFRRRARRGAPPAPEGEGGGEGNHLA